MVAIPLRYILLKNICGTNGNISGVFWGDKMVLKGCKLQVLVQGRQWLWLLYMLLLYLYCAFQVFANNENQVTLG